MKKENRKLLVAGGILLLLVAGIWVVRLSPVAGEWYARHIYPVVAAGLSALSGVLPFALGDVFVVVAVAALLIYIMYAIYRRRPFRQTTVKIIIFLGYVYVWFYFAWGLNYFRLDFYTRTEIPYRKYDAEAFRRFVDEYADSLNRSYVVVDKIDTALVRSEVKAGYERIAPRFGMITPAKTYRAKPMLSSALMSKTGVLGYMQPFFAEFCMNEDLLPVQYPQTYAHELSHRLSISNEAEANLYAYLVCTASDVPEIRFSGYFSLFPYVMGNAARTLPEDEYRAVAKKIRPEIWNLYRTKQEYWSERYSRLIGAVQDRVYNMFLKGNNIPGGTANYSEVVGLLMSYRQAEEKALISPSSIQE